MDAWAWVAIAAGVLLLLVGIGYLADWGLRKRFREALQQRGREENEAAQRLRELTGNSDRGCGE